MSAPGKRARSAPPRPTIAQRSAADARGPAAVGGLRATDARGPATRGSLRAADARGQAAVELVALLPLFAAVLLAILQALAAGAAAELADHAAQSGAVAVAQGGDGAAAARDAVPGWARDRIKVSANATRVRVTLTPPSLLPGLGEQLRATAVADAGPAS